MDPVFFSEESPMIKLEPGTADTFPNVVLNRKRVAFTRDCVFEVQIGKGKGKYSTRYRFTGDIKEALFWYAGINIGNGYKKRLVCWSLNKPVLLRSFS